MSTAIATLEGEVGFNNLFEPTAFKDTPDGPKKYSVKLTWEGDAAKKMRSIFMELGRPAMIKDGKLSIAFSCSDKRKPRIVGKDGQPFDVGDMKFVQTGSRAKVMFTPFAYEGFGGGVSFQLEAVMLLELAAAPKSTLTPISIPKDADIDLTFIDAF